MNLLTKVDLEVADVLHRKDEVSLQKQQLLYLKDVHKIKRRASKMSGAHSVQVRYISKRDDLAENRERGGLPRLESHIQRPLPEQQHYGVGPVMWEPLVADRGGQDVVPHGGGMEVEVVQV